jgi:hypothetical protein
MNETNKPSKKKLFVLLGILVIAIALVVVASLSARRDRITAVMAPVMRISRDRGCQQHPRRFRVLEDIKPAEVSESQPLKDVKIVVPGANR